MSNHALPAMTPAEFLAHVGRLTAGPGALRRTRRFVRRCLADAAAAGRRVLPTVGRLESISTVLIDISPTQARQIAVVVDEAPSIIAEVVAAIDRLEFDLDADDQVIVGRLGLEPMMSLRIGGDRCTRLTVAHCDPIFGWSN